MIQKEGAVESFSELYHTLILNDILLLKRIVPVILHLQKQFPRSDVR